MKHCSGCDTHKDENQFNKAVKYKDGLQTVCRACSKAANAAWAKAHPEKHRKRVEAYRNRNPITHRQAATRNRLKKTYNITAEEYLRLFDSQGGACKLCELPLINLLDSERDFTGQPDNNVARVDHCHKTGRVRNGTICVSEMQCLALVNSRTTKSLLLKAARYLRESATASAQPDVERNSSK